MADSLLHWIDRLSMPFAPRWTMRRVRARVALDLVARNYEGATTGRRSYGWKRSAGDVNAANAQRLVRLRENARDLIRNNPYAESAVATIADHTVSWGIVAKPAKDTPQKQASEFMKAWKAWAETSACDADRRNDFAGLQKLVMRSVAESGEVLVRRRWRMPQDNLPIPLQLQVLEADYLDHSKDNLGLSSGGFIIQGIEYDSIGRRRAYWLFREHPGASVGGLRSAGYGQSVSVPASEILHVFKPTRPGQARGASWFAPVLLRLKDLDEYEDAALVKQKVAACLAVITTDIDGTTPPLGGTNSQQETWDYLEPGMIANLAPGKTVTVVDPPSVSEHDAYAKTVLRAIATGLGVTVEDLTGDYSNMPYSAARMSRLRHYARVEDWRWRMLIPQFCDPVWNWAVEAARVSPIAANVSEAIKAEWTAPPPPLIEPDVEARAYQLRLRIGAMTWPEMQRELGYDPDEVFKELQDWNAKFTKAGVILDSDPRETTQQGGPRYSTPPSSEPATSANGSIPKPPAAAATASPNGATSDVKQAVDAAFKGLERQLSRLYEQQQQRIVEAPTVNVPVTIERGAIHVEPTPAPEVNVDARTSFADGAVRIDVAAPPPAAVHVAPPAITVEPAQLVIEEGAIQVSAPTTIAEGAVQVTPPTPPTVTVIRTRREDAAHELPPDEGSSQRSS